MKLYLIAAAAENNVIGYQQTIPWHIPNDLHHFKRITLGSTVIMGRKTYESIGKPLPGRVNIVLSRDQATNFPGTTVAFSLEHALYVHCATASKVFIIGGSSLYATAIKTADKVFLTRIHKSFQGDTLFPPIPDDMTLTANQTITDDPDVDFNYSYVEYTRLS